MSNVKFSADIRKDFGRWMQKQREDRGLSQKFVAGKIGISETQLSRIENGKSGTERDTVILWAKAIGFDENEALRQYKPETNTPEIPKPIIESFQRSGAATLNERDINLVVNFIDMLQKQKEENKE